jgi:hypothetical protein
MVQTRSFLVRKTQKNSVNMGGNVIEMTSPSNFDSSKSVLQNVRLQNLPRRLKTLRNFLGLILGLLYLQYELGMETNLSNPPALSPIQSFSIPKIFEYLTVVGPQAVLHASNGLLVFAVALAVVYLSLRTHVRSIQIFGCAGPAALVFTMFSGLTFVLSGFQNGGTFGMAHGFIAVFTIYAVELYLVAKWMYGSSTRVSTN